MRAEVADHGAQRSRNEYADPVAEVRLGSNCEILAASKCSPLFSQHQTFGASARQGMSKLYRFIRTMPACVTVDAIGLVVRPRLKRSSGTPNAPRSRWPEFARPPVLTLMTNACRARSRRSPAPGCSQGDDLDIRSGPSRRSRDRQLPGLPFFDDLPEVRCHLTIVM